MRKSFKFNNNKVELNISYYSQKENYIRTKSSGALAPLDIYIQCDYVTM